MGEFFCPKHGQRWYFDYSKDAAKPDKQCVLCIQENNAALRARAEKAEAALAAAQAWQEAVIDVLVVSCIYAAEHDANPRKAIQDLVAWETKIALDLAVSQDAQALIDRGKAAAQERCAKLEQDAARYRWLRDESPNATRRTPTVLDHCPMDKESAMLSGPTLDRHIDDQIRGSANG